MFAFFKNSKRGPDFVRSGEELLEVREGVVVDAKGRPLSSFDRLNGFAQKARAFSARSGIPMTAMAFAIPVGLFMGMAALTLVGGFAAVFGLLMLIESAFGVGVKPSKR